MRRAPNFTCVDFVACAETHLRRILLSARGARRFHLDLVGPARLVRLGCRLVGPIYACRFSAGPARLVGCRLGPGRLVTG